MRLEFSACLIKGSKASAQKDSDLVCFSDVHKDLNDVIILLWTKIYI